MLKRLLNSIDNHEAIASSVLPPDSSSSFDYEKHLDICEWFSFSNSPDKFTVSLPQNSNVSKAIKASGTFNLEFFAKDDIQKALEKQDSLTLKLTNFNSLLNLNSNFLQLNSKSKVGRVECDLIKDLESGSSIIFTGKIKNISFR